jgi:hypothetical protein
MAGHTQWWQQDAPGGIADTERQAREAYVAAMQASTSNQTDAARFITENGQDVLGGHAPVGEVSVADIGRDPDEFGPDASDV